MCATTVSLDSEVEELRGRMTGAQFLVSDTHKGLKRAIAEMFRGAEGEIDAIRLGKATDH